MLTYVIRRILAGIVLLWVSITIIFVMLQSVPGDPAMQLLSDGTGDVSPEVLARVRAELGLDKPVWEQYVSYLTGLATGNFGDSFAFATPVIDLLAPRLGMTLQIALYALVLGTVIGIATGVVAARASGLKDTVFSGILSLGISVPVYVVGALLVLVFSLQLGLLPAGGFTPISEGLGRHLSQVTLPVVTLSIPVVSVVGRMARSSVLENIQQDWVRTSRSWGISPNQVFHRHVLRNSLTSVTTVVGLEAGTLIGSTVLVEKIFNLPGIGSLLIDAVTARDFPVVQAVVIVVCIAFILLNIIVDVTYGFLDPRIRRKAA